MSTTITSREQIEWHVYASDGGYAGQVTASTEDAAQRKARKAYGGTWGRGLRVARADGM